MKCSPERIWMWTSSFGFLLTLGFLICCMASCTLSLQNVETQGKASDVIDDNQTIDPKVDATIPLVSLKENKTNV